MQPVSAIMKLQLAVLFLVVAGAAAYPVYGGHHDKHDDHDDKDDEVSKDMSNNIAKFTADIINYGNTIDNAIEAKGDLADDIIDIKYKIRTLEDDVCTDQEFQCGGKEPHCLSLLMICDGVEDCTSGADESQCKVYTPPDSKWTAFMAYDHCSKRKPAEFKVHIESYTVKDAYKFAPEVTAHAHIKSENDGVSFDDVLHLTGTVALQPGNHVVKFEAPESDGLVAECTFDGVHDNHCHGRFVRSFTNDVCAEFFMKRD